MSGKFPCRSCALPITKKDLSDALLSFTSAQGQSNIVAAFEDMAICIGTNRSFENPSFDYKERRKEFVLEVSNNPKMARNLSEVIKYDVCDQYSNCFAKTFIMKIAWIFELLVGNKSGVDNLTHHQSIMMLMEAEVFLNLVRKVGGFSNLNEENSYHRIVMSLEKFVGMNLKGTSLYERSIFYKSKIFENISCIVNAAEKVEEWRSFLVPTYLIYTNFVWILGVKYCRSVIRSHIKKGTIFKMTNLLSQYDQDEMVLNLLSLHCPELLFQLIEVDKNSFYNKPCNEIDDVLRLSAPLMTKMLLLNWKAKPEREGKKAMMALTIINHYVTNCNDKADQQVLKGIKLSKNLLDLVLSAMRSCKDEADLTDLLNLSADVLKKMDNVEMKDLRPLIPFLIQSMRRVTNEFAPPKESYVLACTKFSLLIARNCGINNVEFMNDLIRMKLIPAKVNVIRYYCRLPGDSHLLQIILIVRSMGELVEKAAKENLLELIDQVLVCFPSLVQYFTDRKDLNLEAKPIPEFSFASELGMFFLVIVRKLTSDVFDNRIACIKPQLNTILESNLVSALGEAIITFKNHETLMYYIKIFAELVHVVDNQKIMKKLVVNLPEIVETTAELFESYSKATNQENVYHQMLPIVRKCIAYAMADVDPNVLGRNDGEIMRLLISFWASVKITDVGMEYPVISTFELNEGECYYEGDAVADILRGSWQLLRFYPRNALEIFKEVLPDSSMFHDCSGVTGEVNNVKKFVLDFVSSYIDRSEEYSTDFLLHITAFVRDLDIDSTDSICLKLLKACKRFLKSHKHPSIVYNISTFMKTSQDSVTEIRLNRCPICESKGLNCYL